MTNSEVYDLACKLISKGLKIDDRQFSEKVDSYLRRRNNQLAQRAALNKELEETENRNKINNEKNQKNGKQTNNRRKLDFLNPKNKHKIPIALRQVKKFKKLIFLGCRNF